MIEGSSNRLTLKATEAQPLQGKRAVDTAAVRDAIVRAARALLTPEQLAEIVVSRVYIERAKGLLMQVYDIDADNAFEVLKWASQTTNVKLRALAEDLTEGLAGFRGRENVQSVCDDLLFKAHARVSPPPAR